MPREKQIVSGGLLVFLEHLVTLSVQLVALEHVVGQTASVEGCRNLAKCPAITRHLLALLKDNAAAIRKVGRYLSTYLLQRPSDWNFVYVGT